MKNMKKLISRSAVAAFLVFASATVAFSEDSLLVIGPETVIVVSGAQKCTAANLQYQQLLARAATSLARAVKGNVVTTGPVYLLVPMVADKFDLLGRHKVADRIRDEAEHLNFTIHGVCITT